MDLNAEQWLPKLVLLEFRELVVNLVLVGLERLKDVFLECFANNRNP